MTTPETRAVLAALTSADHCYLGIRPADATPAEAPCFLLSEHSATSLTYALADATNHWPGCHHWDLIGSDQILLTVAGYLPPNVRAFRTPETLATFHT